MRDACAGNWRYTSTQPLAARPHASDAARAVHRRVDGGRACGGGERHPAVHAPAARVDDEVRRAVALAATDELQAQIDSGLTSCARRREQRVEIAAHQHEAASDADALHVARARRQPQRGGLDRREPRSLPGEIREPGDVLRQSPVQRDGRAALGEPHELLHRLDRDELRRRHQHGLVSRAARRHERVPLDARAGELAVAHVVVHEPALEHPLGRRTERRAVPRGDRVEVIEQHRARALRREALRGEAARRRRTRHREAARRRFAAAHARALGEPVEDGEVEQHVVVGLPRLHERLHARGVRVELREVAPPGVLRVELDGGVEQPAGPRLARRRVGAAVIDDVVHAAEEEVVERGAHVGQLGDEVLGEPRRRFGRREALAGDVRRRRRELEARELGALGLGDVGRGVEIEDVGRRAVRLVAHDAAARVRPVGPRLGEAVEHEVGDGLAIVGEHAPRGVRRAALEQRGQIEAQIVAAARLELVEHPRRPVALAARVVHLVRVVEEAAHAHVAAGEGAVEPAQVVGDRLAREVVDDVPLAARRGALDLLAVPALEEGVQRPLAVERVQVDDAGRRHARGDVLDVARLRVRDDGDERQRLREARLIDRERLEVRGRGDGVLQRGDVARVRSRRARGAAARTRSCPAAARRP